MARKSQSVFSRDLVLAAIRDSFPKLDPRLQVRNPVMFIVELGSVITTVIFFLDLARGAHGKLWFGGVIAIWLWLTVLFANFAEAIAEGRGKAQASALRATRTTTTAHRRSDTGRDSKTCPRPSCRRATWSSSRPERSSPPTARSSRASAPSTNPRSPASRRP